VKHNYNVKNRRISSSRCIFSKRQALVPPNDWKSFCNPNSRFSWETAPADSSLSGAKWKLSFTELSFRDLEPPPSPQKTKKYRCLASYLFSGLKHSIFK
jgi:hypothetical protein